MEEPIEETNKADQLNLYYFNSENILTLLKEIINDIKDDTNLPSILNLLNDSSPKMRLFPDSIRAEEETSSDNKQDKRYTLNEKFKQLQKEINDEIQSVYKSYLEYEKNIFIKVNVLLQEKELLHQLNYVKLVNKMSYLEQIYNDIQKFINFFQTNMQMLKNVLYKIDESLMKVRQPCISVQLIEEKLSTQSDLNYMLEYKIIDEIIVVIPDLLNYYTKIISFNKFNVDNYIPNTNDSNAQNNTDNSSEELSHSLNHSLYQELLKEKENSFYKIKKLQQTTTKELKQKDKELNVLIMSDNFRYKFQNLGILIKYRYKYIKSMGMNDLAYQGSESDGFLNPHYDEECLIQKFIPQKSFEQYCSSKRKLKGNIIKSINAFLVQQFIYETICSAYLYWRIKVGWGLFVGRILSRLIFGLLLRFEFFHNYRLLVLISFLVYGISSYTIDYITNHKETDNINTAKLFLNGLGNPSCVFELFISRYCPRTVFKDKLLQFNNVKYIAMVFGFLLGYGKVDDRWFNLRVITVVLFCLQCVALLSVAFIDTYSAKEEQYQNKELSNEELNIVIKAEEHLENQQNFSKNNYIEDNIKEIIQNEKKKMKIKYLIFVLQLLVIYIIKLDCLVNLLQQKKYKLLLVVVYLLGFITAMVIERKFLYFHFTMLFIVIISVLGSLCYISSNIIGHDDELSILVLFLTLYMFLIISKLMVMKVSFEIPQNLRFCGFNTYLGVSLIRGISFIIAFMYNRAPKFRFIFVLLHVFSLLYSYFLNKPKTFMRVAQNYVIG